MNIHIRIKTNKKLEVFDWISENDKLKSVFRCVAYQGNGFYVFKISISNKEFAEKFLDFCKIIDAEILSSQM